MTIHAVQMRHKVMAGSAALSSLLEDHLVAEKYGGENRGWDKGDQVEATPPNCFLRERTDCFSAQLVGGRPLGAHAPPPPKLLLAAFHSLCLGETV